MAKFIITNGVEHTDDQYPDILRTEEGPYCGNCNRGWHKGDGTKIRHADRHAVKMCYAVSEEIQADQRAECEAELAVERLYEDRGYWDARAQEDYEARNGVVHPDYFVAL